jgi:flagellar biosynthesis protein FlhF
VAQIEPLREDIRVLKDAVSQLIFPRVPLPPDMDRIFQELVFQGVRSELASRLTFEASQDLKKSNGRIALTRSAVIKALIHRFPPGYPISANDFGRRQIVALVGPTGVGKTTTLAKLAAHFALKVHKRVSLLTIDAYRIAATEQLKTYGKIMGLPVDVVEKPKEMAQALSRRKDMDLVLIDTAGQSHRDRFRIEELRRFFDGMTLSKHLVLSCPTREREQEEIFNRFSLLGVDRLIFTKLDETSLFGTIVNIALSTGIPISYFTVGQKVPEDIREAAPEIISRLIFSMPNPKGAGREMGYGSGRETGWTRTSRGD